MKLHFKRFCGSWEPCRVCESFTIYLHKNQVHDSPISHPAKRDMSASVGKLEFAVNLAERTSVKGSDRAKSRKPGNVKSQKSAEALKSEASLSSLQLQEQNTVKRTEHLSTHSHHSVVNRSHLDSSLQISLKVLDLKQTLHKFNTNKINFMHRYIQKCVRMQCTIL